MRARFGWLTGAFLVGYGIARIIGEFFRQPDAFLGFLLAGATMGQLLSIPMLMAGAWLILRTRLMERLDHFMARANAAYYATRDPFADFTTAPEISQVFGEILGLWAAVTWDLLGRPDPVLLVEAGPGRGTLMADALRAIASAAPAFRVGAAGAPDRDVAAAAGDPGGAAAGCDLARRAGYAARRADDAAGQRVPRRAADPPVRAARGRWLERFVEGGRFRGVRHDPHPNPPPLRRRGFAEWG